MNPATLDLLRRVVTDYNGSVIGSPTELAHDGRTSATAAGLDWHDLSWPATGLGLANLLDQYADDLAAAGLVYVHTVEAPGQPEWLAVSAVDCDWTARNDHGGPLPSLATSPLAAKLTALFTRLTRTGRAWTGTHNDLQRAWRSMPDRGGLPGGTWPSSTDKLADLLRLALPELAADGLAVEVGPTGLTATRIDAGQVAA